MNPRVVNLTVNSNYTLNLDFSNGEKKVFDMKAFLSKGVFQKLKEISLFKQAKVSNGTVVWFNEIDICPDTLYEDSLSC